MQALIADDEPLARRGLRARLAPYADIRIVAEAGDGESAARAIRQFAPDVVFLDIDMPGLAGTALARAMPPSVRPEVIFVSAHAEFAVEAFELPALDYLLKPVTAERLRCAIRRLRERLGQADGAPADPYCLRVRDGETTTLLPIESIDFISAAGDYMVLHAGGERLIHRATMTELADDLRRAGILRIHRSTLVAADRIRRVECGRNGDGDVVLKDGTRLRYSRSYRAALSDYLDMVTWRTQTASE